MTTPNTERLRGALQIGDETDTLIITIYNRPEATLRCLRSVATNDLSGVQVILADAPGERPGMKEALREASEILPFHHVKFHTTLGQCQRMAFEAAVRMSNLILYLEDDYVVEPGFIDWHRQVHRRLSPFISCADNDYRSTQDSDPSGVVLTRSKFSGHAGAIINYNLERLLNETWGDRNFEELAHNYIIRHKLMTVFPTVPRAHDTGEPGMNQPKKDIKVEFKNPPTPSHFTETDWTYKWRKDYAAQKKWGWQ